MTLDYAEIMAFEATRTEVSAHIIASAMVGRLSAEELREFAEAHVRYWVDAIRRNRAREIEEASTRALQPSQYEVAKAIQSAEVAEFEVAKTNPGGYVGNAQRRRRFKRWMGDDFPDWYARGMERVMRAEVRGGAVEDFEADWHPDGFHAYYRDQMSDAIGALIDDFGAQIRLEVTAELLETAFALGDGRRVTWGEATVAQHQQRIELLQGNLTGTLETAARHQAAISMLKESGATCLVELAKIPA